MFQFTSTATVLLMVLFYGITFLLSLRIKQKNENVDGYMVSNGSIGFGMSAASMTATWIWAASFMQQLHPDIHTAFPVPYTMVCGVR